MPMLKTYFSNTQKQKNLDGLDQGSFYLNSPKTLNFKWGGYLDEFGIDCMSHAI
jgi:hypothetical protein